MAIIRLNVKNYMLTVVNKFVILVRMNEIASCCWVGSQQLTSECRQGARFTLLLLDIIMVS